MRKISVKVIIFTVIVLVLVIALGILYRCLTRGVRVCIRNESPRKIEIADINYTGGSTGPISIDAGKSFEVYVNPTGKADELNMRYIDRHGTQVYQRIYVYICPNWGGTIEITIDANDIVTNSGYALP
jgi:hypothetical protein